MARMHTNAKGEPPLPRGFRTNPVGQVTRIKREQRRLRGALREVEAWLVEEFDRIPRTELSANASGITVNRYEYLISLPELERIIAELARRLGDLPDDLLVEAAVAAYRQGTGDEVVNLAAITSDYTREISQVIQSDPWQRRVALMRARVFEEMATFEGDTATDLARVLSQAVSDGRNPMQVRDTIRERFGVSRSRGERIARSEIVQAYRRARWDEDADANERLGIRTGLLWISAFAPNSRQSHMALNGEVVTQDFVREFYADPGNSINCYLPGTKVSGRFVAGSKASYKGDVITLMTRSGNKLTVTPNHPVMTTSGLVAAAEINEGDDLLAYGLQAEVSGGVGALDSELMGSSIEDVFGALVNLGHSFRTRVGAVDFHGDGRGMDEYIDVVDAKGVLTVGGDAKAFKFLDDFEFKHSNLMLGTGCSPEALGFVGIDLTTPSFVGGAGSATPFLCGEFGVLNSQYLALTESLEPGLAEPSGDSGSTDPDVLADLEYPITSEVPIMEGAYIEPVLQRDCPPAGVAGLPGEPSLYPVSPEEAVDVKLVDAAPGGNGGSRVTSKVFIDDVVRVERFPYSGHVYDLQEVSGLMVADGIIASNCMCNQISVLLDDDGNVVTPGVVERVKSAAPATTGEPIANAACSCH